MSSADFKAFCTAESEERLRLARVYQGLESDRGLASAHYRIDHLQEILAGDLTAPLRSAYMKEYWQLRARLRALMMTRLTRKDFYADASHTALRDSAFWLASLASKVRSLTQLLLQAPKDLQKVLKGKAADAVGHKQEVLDQLRAESGLTDEDPVMPEDVIRASISPEARVNTRGVSTEVTYYNG